MAKYNVDGFLFETEEEAKQAKKESEGIAYIRAQTRMNNPNVIFNLYHRLIEQNVFETAVGIEFLRELQAYLDSIPYMKKEDIAPIPIPNKALEAEKELRRVRHETRRQQILMRREGNEGIYRRLFHVTGILCIVLFVIVVGMFAVTYASGKSMNIFNYEQKVIDKYEAWEQELEQREEDVSRREQILQNQMNQ